MERITLEQWFKENNQQRFLDLFEQKCQGQYETIFARCGGSRAIDSINKNFKHVKCPNHDGGDSNYRAIKGTSKLGSVPFNDYAYGVCNTCGMKRGLVHLKWLRGDKSLKETRKAVKDAMGWTWGDILNDPRLDREMTAEEYSAAEERRRLDEKRRKAQEKAREEREKKEAIRHNKWVDGMLEDARKGCAPLDHPVAEPARKYYQGRGIPHIEQLSNELSQWIRYSPRSHVQIGTIDYGWYPAIISKIVNGNGDILYLHRIIIDEHGNPIKPSVEIDGVVHTAESSKLKTPAKKLIDNSNRGIKPFNAHLVQGVCEGQEVGLATRYYDGLPIDMAGDAESLKNWRPQEGVKVVLILVDNDRPNKLYNHIGGTGVGVGFELQEALDELGVTGILVYPNFEIPEGRKSVDHNDVYACFQNSCSPPILKQWREFEIELEANNGKVTETLLEKYGVAVPDLVIDTLAPEN